jgi:hypothetical protein
VNASLSKTHLLFVVSSGLKRKKEDIRPEAEAPGFMIVLLQGTFHNSEQNI